MKSLVKITVLAMAYFVAGTNGTSIGYISGGSSGALLYNVTQRHIRGQSEESLTSGRRSTRNTGQKFTADELIHTRFPLRISDDIDLDPCKSVGLMGDIALPNVNYETQWQTQRLNKSFQQELERMKQEVYHEGLQVEEEGLTDIIRKKTKLPETSQTNGNESDGVINAAAGPHKNDVVLVDPANTIHPTSPSNAQRFDPRTNEAVMESLPEVNPTIIDNNSASFHNQSGTSSKAESITNNPAPSKSTPTITHHFDQSKIQSDSKDIVYDPIDNIATRVQTTTTTTTTAAPTTTHRNIIEGSLLNAVNVQPTMIATADVRKRHRRRRRQGRKLNKSRLPANTSKSDELTKKNETRPRESNNINNTQVDSKPAPRKNMHLSNVPVKQKTVKEIDEPIIKLMTSDQASSIPRDWDSLLATATSPLSMLEQISDMDRIKELQHHHRATRAATAKKERIWDYGVIPYEIDANFSGAHKALFKQAMRHWENFTCVKFVERNHNDHPNYIIFTVRPCGCCSFVGKRGNGGQAISIGKNCDKFGIVVHELGHVVGFWHEHTRPDREQHVVIERGNIMNGQDYNFNKLTTDDVNSLGLPYDYESIMHYARNTFSKGTFLDTIHPVDSFETLGKKRPDIGQRLKLSEGDIAQANLLYKCPKCGRTYQDNANSFHSPSYYSKNTAQEAESCEWRITATHGEKIVLNITELDIFKSNSCRTDYLEIRDGYWHKSPVLGRYCGSGRIPELIKSTGSRMLLTFVTSKQIAPIRSHRGFAANYEAVCGGDLNLASGGRLESPNYPLDYLPNKECIWRITVEEEYQVALKFQSFEVENHDNCVYDYVEVRDGDSADSRLIGVYCGYKVPKDIRSTTNKIFVKFVSDSSVQKAGFSAIFVKELDECELQNHGCQHECINTLGGYQCSCYIGYELHSDKKSCENACGGVIEALNGTFTSPSYPDLYPMSKECVWEILVPEQYRITLNFTQFDLEGNNYHASECDYDSVAVYSKLDDPNPKRHGTFCGARDVPMITSEGNTMRIIFRSDHTIQRIGFSALFFTDIDECAVNNGGCMHECKNTIGSYVCSCHNGYILHENGLDCKEGGCKYEITAPQGQIYSPNYPEAYPPRKDCVWHFSTTPGHRIRLTFTVFEMEPHQECTYDHIAIYDGDSPDSFTLGRFCGSKLPHPISASSNEMFMVFKSDSSVQRGGFAATHSTACGGRLQATNRVQHFYSHSRFGDDDYNNNANCDWSIEAVSGSNVQLTFLTFDIENEKNCSFDFVDVFGSLDDYNGPLYGRYCGSNKPPDIISANEALLVRFTSDSTMAFKGFSASYVAVDPFGSEEMESDSSEMVTPFPGYLQSVIISAEEDSENEDDYNEFEHYKLPNNFYNHDSSMELPINQI